MPADQTHGISDGRFLANFSFTRGIVSKTPTFKTRARSNVRVRCTANGRKTTVIALVIRRGTLNIYSAF